jgi:S1-C subfamily serine protease
LQEWVARNRPGKEIQVRFLRDGTEKNIKAKLKDHDGSMEMNKREVLDQIDGLSVEDVPYQDLAKLKLEGGVKVSKIKDGKWKASGIKQDFIIAFIDRVPVDNVEDFNRILEYKRGGVLIEGYYPDGEKGTFGVEW